MFLDYSVRDHEILAEEGGIIEWSQFVIWLKAMIIGMVMWWNSDLRLDRAVAFWLGFVAFLALLRESDAQHLLNPETLGEWGVRYRIDWWLSGDVSIPLRLFWFVVFTAAITAAALPLTYMKFPFFRMLLSGDRATGLFIFAILLLFCGYAMDDLLRDAGFLSPGLKMLAEELFELAGAVAYLASMIALYLHSLSGRVESFSWRGHSR